MIYIVEDDRNIQEIELFALKNSGYQAVGFETAKAFYKALGERLPELVLLDIMLPDEDGMSILKRLRSRADTQRIPVILVTAKSTEIDNTTTSSPNWTASRLKRMFCNEQTGVSTDGKMLYMRTLP